MSLNCSRWRWVISSLRARISCFKSLNPYRSVFNVVLRSWSWVQGCCWLKLGYVETEVCFEEDEDYLGSAEVLGQIELAYEVERGCCCVLLCL